MPEFEDNSILGDSIYQHINFDGREVGHHGPVDMKMFEQDDFLHSDENGNNIKHVVGNSQFNLNKNLNFL